MEPATRTALVQHLGELTMDAICSVARAKELEQENAELRRMVTEERLRVKQLTESGERSLGDVQQLRGELDKANAKVVELSSKPSTRRKMPPLSK